MPQSYIWPLIGTGTILKMCLALTPYFVFVTLALSGFLGGPVIAGNAKIIESSADGRVLVEERIIKGHTYETLLIRTGNHFRRVPDERVSDIDRHGKQFFYNEDDPDTRYDHGFCLSPRSDWLFVTRKLFHPVDVGYLYRLSGKRPVQIRPRGRRFDEAAIRFFARHLHVPYPSIGAGRRIIGFNRWTSDRLIFDLSMCEIYDRSKPVFDYRTLFV